MARKCPRCESENTDTARFCSNCAAPLSDMDEAVHTKTLETPIEELTRGSVFAGRYEIIEELGKGGMGRVFRVEDKKVKEEVALKLIKPEIAADKTTLERFKNELKLARKIRHKNVGSMYELLEEKGIHFITMEHVRGEDLKSFIRRSGQLAVGTTIRIAKQLCEGLAEAHQIGVIHRDLKPSNIMIDREGNARILDFGIARTLKEKGITDKGVTIGTPEYMSPEQAEGKEVNQQSDIYSLGILLYEMLTGSLPFEGDTPFAIGIKHKSEIPKNPRELNPQIPDDLCGAVLKCLEKDSEKRYQSAGDIHSELEKIEKGIPTTEKEAARKKPATSKETAAPLRIQKLLIPGILIIAVIVTGLILWHPWPKKEAFSFIPGKQSIAVLPFEDLSPQKDQEHLCDGFAVSIIGALTQIEDLRVPAPTSSFSFRGRDQNLKEIGEKLKVETVLRGNVQKAGNRVRVTARLINIEDESLLWSDQFDGNMEDIFAFQDEISLKIIDRLRINLIGEDKETVVRRYTENAEAYNLYVLGRWFWNKRTEEGFKKSIDCFEQAIDKDPDYALAYAGIADAYNLLPIYASLPTKDYFPLAKEAALKALEIDETLAEAHTSLAWVTMNWDLDWEMAEKEFQKAIGLNPFYATAHHWYALCLMWTERFDEAVKEITRANELDPLSLIINREIGRVYFYAGQNDQAIKAFKKTIEMDPNFSDAHQMLGTVYMEKARYEEALSEFRKEKSFYGDNDPMAETFIGLTYVRMGKKDQAQQILDSLLEQSKKEYVPPHFIAILNFALEEKNTGFEWLERAYEDRTFGLVELNITPAFDTVRSDPRFKTILKKVGLEK